MKISIISCFHGERQKNLNIWLERLRLATKKSKVEFSIHIIDSGVENYENKIVNNTGFALSYHYVPNIAGFSKKYDFAKSLDLDDYILDLQSGVVVFEDAFSNIESYVKKLDDGYDGVIMSITVNDEVPIIGIEREIDWIEVYESKTKNNEGLTLIRKDMLLSQPSVVDGEDYIHQAIYWIDKKVWLANTKPYGIYYRNKNDSLTHKYKIPLHIRFPKSNQILFIRIINNDFKKVDKIYYISELMKMKRNGGYEYKDKINKQNPFIMLFAWIKSLFK